MRVEAGAHGGAAERQLVQVLDRKGEAAQVRVKLGHPAAGFLSEGERHGVHEVGPADLDDARPGLGLGRQRVTQGGHGRNDLVNDGFCSGDVHRGGEGVVGRLRPVDVVVGVHGRLAAEHAAGHLDGTVGDDLVGVHVGLRARAGLPHAQREMVVELPVDDLLGRSGNQVTDRGVQLAKGDVRARRGLLEDAKGADDATGHGVLTDVEVDQRAGGLAAVVPVRRNLEFAHGVGFDAHVAHASLAWRDVHVPFPFFAALIDVLYVSVKGSAECISGPRT